MNAEERVLDALVGATASPATRDSFRKKLRNNELDDKEIEIEVADTGSACPASRSPACRAPISACSNLTDMFGKAMGGRTKKVKTTVKDIYDVLIAEESDKLIDNERDPARGGPLGRERRHRLPRRDRQDRRPRGGIGAGVSREGVQRDLLPLVEGTTVSTKYGPVKTDHILFIASGAFHVVQALGPAARTAGPPADPRRAAAR